MSASAKPTPTRRFYFFSLSLMFLVFKLISNRQSKLCGGSLFDYASMYLSSRRVAVVVAVHIASIVGSFQRLLEIQIYTYVTSVCSSIPPTHSLILVLVVRFAFVFTWMHLKSYEIWPLRSSWPLMFIPLLPPESQCFLITDSFSLSQTQSNKIKHLSVVRVSVVCERMRVWCTHTLRTDMPCMYSLMWTKEFRRVFVCIYSFVVSFNFDR